MTTPADRAAFTASLRQLADILDSDPAIPLPHDIERREVSWYIQGTIGDALAVRAVMDDPKTARTDSAAFPVDITGTVAGMRARVQIVDRIALAQGNRPALPALHPLLDDVAPVTA